MAGKTHDVARRGPKPGKRRQGATKGPEKPTPGDVGANGADFRVEMWPIHRIQPYPGNAKQHSAEAIAKLADILKAVGPQVAIVVDEQGVILKGHRTRLAALHNGATVYPVKVATGLSKAQAKAWRLADNRLAKDSEDDIAILRGELGGLEADGFDLSLTGFSTDELEALLHPERKGGLRGGADPDAVPEVPSNPITRLGDLILLGGHRLVCGDSTQAHIVDLVLGDQRPNLMVTDPPYGVEYDPTWREQYDQYKRHATGKVENDDRSDWREAWALFPGDVAYCWHAGVYAGSVQASFEAAGFQVRSQIIWAKQHFVFGRGDYHWQHEPCWYLVRKGKTGGWTGDRKQTTLWEIRNLNPMGGSEEEESSGHGTQKPVECMRRPVENNSSPGEAVYDPFLGSGTTLIGCEMTGRICYGIELKPAYCDVIVTRWEQATGQKAQRPGKAA